MVITARDWRLLTERQSERERWREQYMKKNGCLLIRQWLNDLLLHANYLLSDIANKTDEEIDFFVVGFNEIGFPALNFISKQGGELLFISLVAYVKV